MNCCQACHLSCLTSKNEQPVTSTSTSNQQRIALRTLSKLVIPRERLNNPNDAHSKAFGAGPSPLARVTPTTLVFPKPTRRFPRRELPRNGVYETKRRDLVYPSAQPNCLLLMASRSFLPIIIGRLATRWTTVLIWNEQGFSQKHSPQETLTSRGGHLSVTTTLVDKRNW